MSRNSHGSRKMKEMCVFIDIVAVARIRGQQRTSLREHGQQRKCGLGISRLSSSFRVPWRSKISHRFLFEAGGHMSWTNLELALGFERACETKNDGLRPRQSQRDANAAFTDCSQYCIEAECHEEHKKQKESQDCLFASSFTFEGLTTDIPLWVSACYKPRFPLRLFQWKKELLLLQPSTAALLHPRLPPSAWFSLSGMLKIQSMSIPQQVATSPPR